MLVGNHMHALPITMDAGSNVESNGSGASACGNPGTTPTPGATASGGVGTLTYLWEQTGTPATNGPYACSDTGALNPTWTDTSVCDGDTPTETWQLTVTDEIGQSDTDTIVVSLIWTDTSV